MKKDNWNTLQGRPTRPYSNTRSYGQRQSRTQPHRKNIECACQSSNRNLCLVAELSQDNQRYCTEEDTVVTFILNNVAIFLNITAKSMGTKKQEQHANNDCNNIFR